MKPYLHGVIEANEELHRHIDVSIRSEKLTHTSKFLPVKSYKVSFVIPDIVYVTYLTLTFIYNYYISEEAATLDIASVGGAKSLDLKSDQEAVLFFYNKFNTNEEEIKTICKKAIECKENKIRSSIFNKNIIYNLNP